MSALLRVVLQRSGSRKTAYAAFEALREVVAGLGLSGDLTPKFNTVDLSALDCTSPTRGRPERSGAKRGGAIRISRSREYPLWFGTNRRTDPGAWSSGFTGDLDDCVHYGTCKVAIPEQRKIGHIGSSFLARFLSGNDDRLKLMSDALVKLGDGDFWASIRNHLAKPETGKRTRL